MSLYDLLSHYAKESPAAWLLGREGEVLAPPQKDGRLLFLFKTVADAREFIAANQLDDWQPVGVSLQFLVHFVDEQEGEISHYIWNPPPFGGERWTPELSELKAAALKELERIGRV